MLVLLPGQTLTCLRAIGGCQHDLDDVGDVGDSQVGLKRIVETFNLIEIQTGMKHSSYVVV